MIRLDMPLVGAGAHLYEWIDRWAEPPATPETLENGRTHGVEVTRSGDVVVFAQTRPALTIYGADGRPKQAWGDDLLGAHGLTLVQEDGEERLWLTDQYSGEVRKTTLDGRVLARIEPPAVEGEYAPTWVAVNPENGDIWVADGYGTNIVRRYSADSAPLGEINGEEGPGRFQRPHGVAFSPAGELFVTDRRNKRILVYDGEGRCRRWADDITHSPCSFAFHAGLIYVPELFGGLKILDADLHLVAELGANSDVRPAQGWPDQEGWGWPTLEGWPDLAGTPHIQPGKFSSPHDAAVAPNGDIYVVEWIIGGRITKLAER